MYLSAILSNLLHFVLQVCRSVSHLHIFSDVVGRARTWMGFTFLNVRDPGKKDVQKGAGDIDRILRKSNNPNAPTPSSVNYHFTRRCNYKCGFCFHTAKTSFVLPLDEAKRGFRLLKDAGEF